MENKFAFLQSRTFRIIFSSYLFFFNQVLSCSQPEKHNHLMIKLQPSAAWANLTESWPKFGLSKLTAEQINSKLVTASWST